MHAVVTLFDVDNTLLDNDAVTHDLSTHLARSFGSERRDRYWAIFEALRTELGYADYLGALQRYRREVPEDAHLLTMAAFLLDYPFAERLYPGALAAIAQLRRFGPAVILSDGDVVFQPRKIARSGLWDVVQGQVLIYVHKELMLDEVARLYPARHYLVVDDKLRILAAVKQHWGERVTCIFVRQGHYARDAGVLASYPPADLTVDGIGELTGYGTGAMAAVAAVIS
ncbi:MAG TPA: HAD family hydrolase [Steroidobacteraceae bacterium]|jgi:FMN phosphatase YigB (HAD superfamily)